MLARFNVLPPAVRQLVGYLVIGAFTTSLNLVLFAGMVSAFGWRSGAAATAASTTAYVLTSLLAYVLNSRIAFRDRHAGDSAATMTRFAVTFGSSAGVSALVFSGVHAVAGDSSPALAAAQVAAIVTVIVWNFTLLRLWVFTHTGESAAAHAR
jgi:putative flippase GtrA